MANGKLPEVGGALAVPQPSMRITRQPRDTAAEGLGEIGGSISQSAREINDVFEQEQARTDTLRVEDAFNKLRQRYVDLSVGNDGFGQKRGADAVKTPLLKDFSQKFDDYYGEIAGELDNGRQKEALHRRYEVTKTQFQQDILQHMIRENGVYHKNVLDSTIETESNIASMAWNRPDDVMASMERIRAANNEYGKFAGWDANTTNAQYVNNVSKLHAAVITEAVNNGNPGYAKLWLKTHRSQITPDMAENAAKDIETADIREQGQNKADAIFGKGKSRTQMMEEARSISDPKVRDDVVSRIKSRFVEEDAIRQRDYADAWDEASKIIAEGGSRDAIPPALWNRMSGDDRDRAESIIRQRNDRALKPDSAKALLTYFTLLDAAHNAPEAFARENLNAYIGLVDADKLERLKMLQGKPPEMAMSRTKDMVLKQGAADLGLDPKDMTKDTPNGRKLRAFYDRVDQEGAAFQAANSRIPSVKEWKEITDRLAITVARDPSAVFFKGERPAISAEIPGVPPDLIDELAYRVKEQNMPVTDENIKKLFDYIQRNSK